MDIKKLMAQISIIPDYRQPWKIEYKLSDILLLDDLGRYFWGWQHARRSESKYYLILRQVVRRERLQILGKFKTWNQFQPGHAGGFATKAEVVNAWEAYKLVHGITVGSARSMAERSRVLKQLAEGGRLHDR